MVLRPLSLKRKILFSLTAYLCSIYFSPNLAQAQVFNSSVSTATGGTGRGAVEPHDALIVNPSTLPHLRGRYLFASFAKDETAASLSDNTQESTLPAGFAFYQKQNFISINGALEDVKQQDLALALADFINEKWAMGLTGHYLVQSYRNISYNQSNADLGFLYNPSPLMGLGFVFYNIMGSTADIPEILRLKTSAGVGFNYIYRELIRFRIDGTTDSIFGLGLETYLNKFIITRFGYSKDVDDNREIGCAGLGFNGPRFQINYAYAGNPQKSSDYRHSVDLVIPF